MAGNGELPGRIENGSAAGQFYLDVIRTGKRTPSLGVPVTKLAPDNPAIQQYVLDSWVDGAPVVALRHGPMGPAYLFPNPDVLTPREVIRHYSGTHLERLDVGAIYHELSCQGRTADLPGEDRLHFIAMYGKEQFQATLSYRASSQEF